MKETFSIIFAFIQEPGLALAYYKKKHMASCQIAAVRPTMSKYTTYVKWLLCEVTVVLFLILVPNALFAGSTRPLEQQQRYSYHSTTQPQVGTPTKEPITEPKRTMALSQSSNKPYNDELRWKIVSANLYRDGDINIPGIPFVPWEERASLMAAEINNWASQDHRADQPNIPLIVTVQETVFGDGVTRPQELANAIGAKYAMFAPGVMYQNSPERILGNAIITSEKPLDSQILTLPTIPGFDEARSAGLVRLPNDLVVVTTHLAFPKGPQADRLRLSQMTAILDFIEMHTFESDHIVFTGDFNSSVSSLLDLVTNKNFKSVHKEANSDGDRATWTYQHPIVADLLSKPFLQKHGFLKEEHNEIDHIFTNPNLSLDKLSFSLLFNKAIGNNLWITDHFGLACCVSSTKGR